MLLKLYGRPDTGSLVNADDNFTFGFGEKPSIDHDHFVLPARPLVMRQLSSDNLQMMEAMEGPISLGWHSHLHEPLSVFSIEIPSQTPGHCQGHVAARHGQAQLWPRRAGRRRSAAQHSPRSPQPPRVLRALQGPTAGASR